MKDEVVLTPGGSKKDGDELKVLNIKKSTRDKKEIKTPDEFYRNINIDTLERGIKKILETNKFIRPSFSSSWISKKLPRSRELVNEYSIGETTIKHYYLPEDMESLYYVSSEDYKVKEDEARIIQLAIEELSERYPENVSMDNRSETRKYIKSAGIDIIRRIARKEGFYLGDTEENINKKIIELSSIMARHTAGLGVLEALLNDKRIQDIYVDAPAPSNPLYVTLGDIIDERMGGNSWTNVILGKDDIDGILSRFRMESGRPFSESDPVLEYNMDEFNIRVTVIGEPLSPEGVALALRRHSEEPWTLLRLIANGTLTPLSAGLLSFLIDGRSTILVAGSRGAGKTSLLGALTLEFPVNQRILTIEDTQELPTRAMQQLGYKVQNILVGSESSGTGYEKTPQEALRVSLRLGESAIIMGEVRGEEAKTLYETMRAGTAGSSVMGTFHANSANSVFERAVHDIGIPAKSFSATDIVAIINLKRPGGSQTTKRKLSQVSELDKECDEDGVFRDLMTYEADTGHIEETDVMKYSSQVIGRIAREWDMTLEEAYHNIQARAKYRELIVRRAKKEKLPVLLSAEWVKKTNNAFWKFLNQEQGKSSETNYNLVINNWKEWLEESIRYA